MAQRTVFAHEFQQMAVPYYLHKGGKQLPKIDVFKSWFGCSPEICVILWEFIRVDESVCKHSRAGPIHLLWVLMFLKLYGPVRVLASICGVDEKTFLKYVWMFLDALSCLDVVSLL